MRPRQMAPLGALVMLATMTAAIHAMPRQDSNAAAVTFDKQVLPILQKNCQACHRPGEIAPMSFLTYQEVRPWAKAIKAAVVKRQMPPWFADSAYGRFANDKRLSDADIAMLSAWVDGGAAEGDAKDKPAPMAFHDGWNIEPDMVVEDPQRVAPGAIRRNSSKKLNTKVT
jgi:mono/diheme cytochrome c family protein